MKPLIQIWKKDEETAQQMALQTVYFSFIQTMNAYRTSIQQQENSITKSLEDPTNINWMEFAHQVQELKYNKEAFNTLMEQKDILFEGYEAPQLGKL